LGRAKKKEFLLKDNINFGEWDWDDIANEWEIDEAIEWGLEIPNFEPLPEEDEEFCDKCGQKL